MSIRPASDNLHPQESTRTLTFTFKVLSLCGVWLPQQWESQKALKISYRVFSIISVIGIYGCVALQIALLASSKLDVNFLADIMFTLLTALSVCLKMMLFLARRDRVIRLRESLADARCAPRDDEERGMLNESNEFVKNFTVGLNFIAQATLFCHLIAPLLQDPASRQLPFRVWLPYDLRDDWNYWITYGLEIVPMIVGVLVNATTDVVVSGFVLQACTQLDFLKRRLHRLPDLVDELQQRSSLKTFVVHHDFVIKFAENVTRTFDVIIIEQYVASVLLFSVIVYQFTLRDITPLQTVMAVGYIICMTGELFSYCWYGNEITLKCLELGDEIYRLDWMALSRETNKALMFIMLRTSKPIVMSYGDLVVLNTESFKTIMKVTYSAFNVLKSSTA